MKGNNVIELLDTRDVIGAPEVMLRYAPGYTPYTFSRASVAWQRDASGVLVQTSSGVLRDAHHILLSGTEYRTTLLEGQRTNRLLRATDASASPWSVNAELSVSNETSILEGRTAKRFTNNGTVGSRATTQVVGTFTGSAETYSIIVEQGTATDLAFRVSDETNAGAAVFHATWTWATTTLTLGSGSATLRKQDLGGGRWRLSATFTGTAGNSRRVWIYPTGTSINTNYGIVHHAQLEDGDFASFPIVTDGSEVARSADSLSLPFSASPQELTVYARFIEQGTHKVINARVVQVGTDAGVRVLLRRAGGDFYTMEHHNGSVTVFSQEVPLPSIGSRIELRGLLRSDGSVQLGISIDEAAESTAPQSGAAALAGAWGNSLLGIGASPEGTNHGYNAFRNVLVFRGIRDLSYCRARAA